MDAESLRIAILKSGKTNRDLAAAIGISEQAFYNKLNGKAEFKSSEIRKLGELLGLSLEDMGSIFLGVSVN